jgi:hypothetical protein
VAQQQQFLTFFHGGCRSQAAGGCCSEGLLNGTVCHYWLQSWCDSGSQLQFYRTQLNTKLDAGYSVTVHRLARAGG